jgi:Photosystem II complex subunit Ycf12
MDFLSSSIGAVNWETIAQLTMLALIVIAGPAVIFVLAFRNGNL